MCPLYYFKIKNHGENDVFFEFLQERSQIHLIFPYSLAQIINVEYPVDANLIFFIFWLPNHGGLTH